MADHYTTRSKRIMIGFVLFFLVVAIVMIDPFVDHWIYPIKYREHIFNNAKKTNMDPYLIMAIIRVETKFNPHRQSSAGAEGLMQLMPDTVVLAMKHQPISLSAEEDVKQPAINIQIGSWYLALLRKEFRGNDVAAIAAYNAGPGRVKQWLKEGIWDGTRAHIDQIPFGETRRYVKRVAYFCRKYQKLYASELSK